MANAKPSILDIPAHLLSPAKIIYIGYLLAEFLLIKNPQCFWRRFVLSSILFFIVQVFHDDWLRILANKCAELMGKKKELKLKEEELKLREKEIKLKEEAKEKGLSL